jgi:hypothetical protein
MYVHYCFVGHDILQQSACERRNKGNERGQRRYPPFRRGPGLQGGIFAAVAVRGPFREALQIIVQSTTITPHATAPGKVSNRSYGCTLDIPLAPVQTNSEDEIMI